MTVKNGSAEIYELGNARRLKRGEGDDPDQYESIGAYLAAMREAAGLTVEQLAERTHIRQSYVAAMEALEPEALPAKPYAIGFVRVVATTLGLPADAVVQRFKEEIGYSKQVEPAEFEAHEPAEAATERPELSLLAVLAILIFMVWCAYQITRPRDVARPISLSGFPEASAPDLAARLTPAANAPANPDNVEPPLLLEHFDPVFPRGCEAGANPEEFVTVAFTISAEGRVVSERVTASTNDCLDRSALNSIRRWRYRPQTVDGAVRPAYEQSQRLRFVKPS